MDTREAKAEEADALVVGTVVGALVATTSDVRAFTGHLTTPARAKTREPWKLGK